MKLKHNNPFNCTPEVVFFDLCGTILDSKALDHQAINYTLKKFGKDPWYITRKQKDATKSMKENFPNFFGNYAEEAYDIYINYLIDNINNISMFDNVYENVRIFKILNTKSAIITNRDKKFIDALKSNKEFQKISPYIDLIVSADDIGLTKPSDKLIDFALVKLKATDVPKSSIVFIGDALADMNTALSYGCIPLLLTATTADITDDFLSRNEAKIYTTNSYDEINHCLFECCGLNRHELFKIFLNKNADKKCLS